MTCATGAAGFRAIRFRENPLIYPELDERIGCNINGPSLIRVPDWIPNPLGRYYLYFAHHHGTFIRLAYADTLRGPWKIYPGGALRLEDTAGRDHIASPDAHVCEEERRVRMYFHAVTDAGQRSFLATSADGLHFQARTEALGPFYFRVFRRDCAWFAIAKRTDAPGGGVLLRSADGVAPFEEGPYILPGQRHVAVWTRGPRLSIFFSRGGDCPERLLVAEMNLVGDWKHWRPSAPVELLRPETKEEGVDLPLGPSRFGAARGPARELRDPAVYEEDGRLYLFYTGAGESNICGAELRPLE